LKVARPTAPTPREIAAVWLLWLAAGAAIFATYSRFPASELYHVSGTGFSGGLSRVLVFSNYPLALVAIAVLALLADRLSSRSAVAVATVGVALSAAVFWPGVVEQSNLDAKTVNAIAAIGVLIAAGFTVVALRGGTASSGPHAGDRFRVVAAAAAVFVGLPWLAAELGFYLTGVPVLDRLFLTGQHVDHTPAVHHGSHHGMDGVLLLITAALLSRVVPSVGRRELRIAVGLYLALMASYAIGNIAHDAWTEQVVKRGWTAWQIPDVTRPTLTIAWGLIVLGAVVLYAASAWWSRRSPAEAVPPQAVAFRRLTLPR
jgi:hypothetical protein